VIEAYPAGHVQILDQRPELTQALMRRRELERTTLVVGVQGRGLAGHEGSHPDEVGIDLVEDAGGVPGVLIRHGPAAQIGHDVFRELESGFFGLLSAPDLLLGGNALVDVPEDVVIPRLEPHVKPREPRAAQLLQLLQGLLGDGLRPGVGRDALQGRELLPEIAEDLQQVTGAHDRGVGVLEEGRPGADGEPVEDESEAMIRVESRIAPHHGSSHGVIDGTGMSHLP
jgi:hypothetical protein